MPLGVLTVYAALAVWGALIVQGIRTRSWRPVLLFGVGLMLFLNLGYVINGVPAAISSFVGIYDVLINIGLDPATDAAAISTCAGNDCTVWTDTFVTHPAWGAAFYDRFTNGPQFRSTLLYGHIIANSLVFVLMHVQLFRPGYGAARGTHKLLGRISFGLLTFSLICSVWLASEHGAVAEYGGRLSQFGFYSMAACVYACAVMMVVTIRKGDSAKHRVWAFRFIGSMWGAFWLFRVVLFVIDPFLRNVEAAAILIVIWGSAPTGVLIAELIRRRIDDPARRQRSETVPAE